MTTVGILRSRISPRMESKDCLTRVRTRPKPLDFLGVRIILSMPSFGGKVKESVPCPSFAVCKRT